LINFRSSSLNIPKCGFGVTGDGNGTGKKAIAK